MYKLMLLFILVFSFRASNCQKIETNTFWLATESRHLKKNSFIYPMDGTVINFNNGKAIFEHVVFDSTQSYPLKIEKNKIYLNDTIWAKIKYYSGDSLILNHSKSMQVKYVRIQKEKFTSKELSLTKNSDWNFHSNGYNQRIMFLDIPWAIFPNEVSKTCVLFEYYDDYRFTEFEKWHLKHINDNLIFALTFGQLEYNFFSVKELNNDTIYLTKFNLNENADFYLNKIEYLGKYDSVFIKENLINKKWKTEQLISYKSWFDLDTTEYLHEFTGFNRFDTLINKSSLLNKELSFQFLQNSKYYMVVNDSIIRVGNWRVSNAGDQIVLNYGVMAEDYIDIITISDKQLIIGKMDSFYLEKGKYEYIDYYYTLKMRN